MFRFGFVLAALGLATPALAQSLPPAPPTAEDQDIAAMVAILRANDCRMVAADIMAASDTDSLTMERGRELGAMVTLQIATGNIGVDESGSTLVLPDHICGGAPLAPTARDNLRSLLFANACQMPKDAAFAAMDDMGFDADVTDFALGAMFTFREVTERIGVAMTVNGVETPAEPTALVLKDPACPQDAPQPAATDARAALLQMLADNSCAMTIDQAQAVMADYGLSISDIVPVASALIASGDATEADGLLTLLPAICPPPAQ